MKSKLVLGLLLAGVVSAGGDALPVPPYPKAALKAKEGGRVGIKVHYGEDGTARAVDVISSSGWPILDTTTQKFVLSNWKNPALANQSVSYFMNFDPANAGPEVDDNLPPVNPDPTALTATLPPRPMPRETALSLYQKHIQSVLAYYWSSEVKKHATELEAGTVKLRYVIHADGTISDIAVVEGNNFIVLKRVGQSVLLAGTPYRPFTPELLAEVGDKYTDTRTFTVARE